MEDLQSVLDRERIADLVNTLFVAVDSRDWDAAAACFAENVHFDMTSAGAPASIVTTPAQIVAGWRDGLAPIQAIHHQSGNIRVRVTGDAAECFCYGIAYHYRPVRSGRHTRVFVGTYDYRLARLAGAWRITHFRFNLKFIEGNVGLELEEPA